MDCPKTNPDMEAASGLPDDPLVEILSRVPVKSLCRFKCVSKAWRDLIADPDHRKKLPQTLEGFFIMDPEHRDGGGDDCGSDYRDGGHGGTDGQFYGFIDVLKRSVRTVDFSYLSELPGPGVLEETRLLHCCNGFLLFAAHYSDRDISESYIVCNPATKQCVSVPSSGLTWEQMISKSTVTTLLFNPGVHWHFNLVQAYAEGYKASGRVYSSETQSWSSNKIDWDPNHISPYSPGVYVNGMLHLLSFLGKHKLTVVDVEGNIQKIIYAPGPVGGRIFPLSGYVGQSRGCLYYICREQKVISNGLYRRGLDRILIWVLQDYNRQQWTLKGSVDIVKMLGKRVCDIYYNVVGIHPDHSLVFLVQCWDQKLVSYNMDSKEVCDLCTLGHGSRHFIPYVPYFSEFGA